MRTAVVLLVAVMATGCNKMLVDKDDLERLKKESTATHDKLTGDINQRLYNLENRRNEDSQLMQKMLEQQRKNNEIGKKTAEILDRIERRQSAEAATQAQETREEIP